MENSVCIYGLKDPETDEIKYVGRTQDTAARLSGHLSSKFGTPYKNKWIKNLKEKGLAPVLVEIETTDHESATERERFHIVNFIQNGATLFNVADGGNGKRADAGECPLSCKIRITLEASAILEIVAPKGGKTTKTGYVSEAIIQKHESETKKP